MDRDGEHGKPEVHNQLSVGERAAKSKVQRGACTEKISDRRREVKRGSGREERKRREGKGRGGEAKKEKKKKEKQRKREAKKERSKEKTQWRGPRIG